MSVYQSKFEELSRDASPGRHGSSSYSFKTVYALTFSATGRAAIKHKLRVKIRRDFYDHQSYARVERWNGERWCNVDSIDYANMLAIKDRQPVTVQGYPDEQVLLHRAVDILRP